MNENKTKSKVKYVESRESLSISSLTMLFFILFVAFITGLTTGLIVNGQ